MSTGKNVRDYFVLNEVYEAGDTERLFEDRLETAFEQKYSTIVIEPTRLGDTIVHWLQLAASVERFSLLSGAAGLVACSLWRNQLLPHASLSALSVITAGISFSWSFDPCSAYKVEYSTSRLQTLPILNQLHSSSPVVLVRRRNRRRQIFISLIAGLAATTSGYITYRTCFC